MPFAFVSFALDAAASAAPPAAAVVESGAARLDVVAEPQRVRLRLTLAQDALVDFAGAPQDDAQRGAAAEALARLHDGPGLLQLDPAAGCGPASVRVEAPTLSAAPAPSAAPAAVAVAAMPGVVARYEFDCAAPGAAAYLDARLLQSFPRLRLVHVTLATPRGVERAMLSRPLTRIPLR